jgi:hypothetical protein
VKIKIIVERLPLHFIVLGILLISFSIFDSLSTQSYILDAILLVLGVLLLTSKQVLEIDTKNKQYSEYYWVLGLKMNNSSKSFKEIISIFSTSVNYSQQYGKYNRRYISGKLFKGFIELKSQDNLFIGQNKKKEALLKKITILSKDLQIPVEDRTH